MNFMEELNKLRKTVISLQRSHIKLQCKVYGEESKEIYEEDNWNLAEHNFNRDLFARSEIMFFIQKVKEDINNKAECYSKNMALRTSDIKNIIDKRAGNLK